MIRNNRDGIGFDGVVGCDRNDYARALSEPKFQRFLCILAQVKIHGVFPSV